MSRLRLVTLATLTPAPELELVASDRGTDRLAEQLRLDAVGGECIDQRAPASFDLGLVDGVLRRAVEVVAPAATSTGRAPRRARARAPTARRKAGSVGRRQRTRRPRLSRLRRVVPVLVERGVVERRASAARPSPRGRSSASTCCRTRSAPCGRSARRPRRRPCRCCVQHGCATMRRSAPARRRCTPATSTTIAPPEAIRLRSGSPTSAPIHPPAVPERVEVGHDLVGAAHDVQQPEQREPEQPPTDGQPEAVHALALARRGRCRWRRGRSARTNRPSPVNQPTTVSTPRPSGPARSR